MSHKNNNFFIVLEGVDGSGKTSASKMLAEKTGAVFYQTPSGFWRKHRHRVENAPVFFRFIFYLLATIHASFEISRILKNKSVICDRYIHSTWAYHIVYGCNFLKYVPLYLLPIKKPDKVYHLMVSRTEREKRISNRKHNVQRDLDSDSLETVHSNLVQLPNLIPVDTNGLSQEQVAHFIFKNLQEQSINAYIRFKPKFLQESLRIT